MPRSIPLTALAVVALLLGGCESLQRTDSVIGEYTPYRIDLVQGNVVTREQLAVLRPGMTRLQVRDLLGTPLLADPFHANRWDYVFTIRRGKEPFLRRSVVVHFEGNAVATIEAPPDLPGEREFVASISRVKEPRVPKLELTPEERAALPPPTLRRDTAPAEPVGPVREYPPLERS